MGCASQITKGITELWLSWSQSTTKLGFGGYMKNKDTLYIKTSFSYEGSSTNLRRLGIHKVTLVHCLSLFRAGLIRIIK